MEPRHGHTTMDIPQKQEICKTESLCPLPHPHIYMYPPEMTKTVPSSLDFPVAAAGNASTLVPRLRHMARERELGLATICHYCGLSSNSLQRLSDPTWNPRLDTVVALEKFLTAFEGAPDRRLSGEGWSLAYAAAHGEWSIYRRGLTALGPFDDPEAALAAALLLETAP